MKKTKKCLIAWTLVAVMALISGSSVAFANEVQTEGNETVSVEAEQSGVSVENEGSTDGEIVSDQRDNARLGVGNEGTYPSTDIEYYCGTTRSSGSIEVFPGETVSYTTSVYSYKSSVDNDEPVNAKVDDYTVDWNIVQIDNETEGNPEIEEYTISQSEDGKRLDITASKTSPDSDFKITSTFHVGGQEIDAGTDYFYVKKEMLTGVITDNYGYNEPALPGDSVDYTFEVSWKKYDEASCKVIELDTSKVGVIWDVELYDGSYNEDTTHKLSDYVSYEKDADNPNILHVRINDEWVQDDKHINITATASAGDEGISSSDYRWIDLSKDVDKFETDECCAEAGSEISIEKLNPQAKRYNKENPQGTVVDEYSFNFLDYYYLQRTDDCPPLEGVTVSPNGKTLKIPKVEDGRYVVCIRTEPKNGMFSAEFYAPLYVGHKFRSTITKATPDKNGTVVKECTLCGKKATETIYLPKTIKLSTTHYTYSGEVKKPSVSVIDAKGNKISSDNYSVSYASGRKSVGKYKVSVTFKGDKYSGSKYTYFDINPMGTSISGVTGAKKAFTVKWKRQSSKMATSTITGYQIRYSTSSKMTGAKTKTVKGYKYTSKKITNLVANKKYYVQVRTYKTVSGKTYYSSWSGVKSVKTR